MNTVVVYLIVTMGSHSGVARQGFGGVSITPTHSFEACQNLSDDVRAQISRTPSIDIDDVVIECKAY